MVQPRTLRNDSAMSRPARLATTARLLSQLARGDGDRAAIQDELIRVNMVVAREVARRYHGRGLAAEDLEQVAYVGLCKAVRNYDAEKATDFLSFAVPTIRGELRRWFRDAGWMVRPPRSIQELQGKVTATHDKLVHELGRLPRPEEIADALDAEVGAVREALAANGCFTPSSLDVSGESSGDAGQPLWDRLGAPELGYARAEARVVLEPLLADLTDRERRMLELRFVRGATQAEIGAEIGVTQMQVSRLLSALLRRLREQLTTEPAAA